jgi:hypothetical protein
MALSLPAMTGLNGDSIQGYLPTLPTTPRSKLSFPPE